MDCYAGICNFTCTTMHDKLVLVWSMMDTSQRHTMEAHAVTTKIRIYMAQSESVAIC